MTDRRPRQTGDPILPRKTGCRSSPISRSAQPAEGFKKVPDPALSTRFGGNGFVMFFGLAKPVAIRWWVRRVHQTRVLAGLCHQASDPDQ
jgi:hypothetical protein